MLLYYKCPHTPGQQVLQGDQSTQVVPKTWVVPRTGPQEHQPQAPEELPQVDEESVGYETERQGPAVGQELGPQALHHIHGSGIHGKCPEAAVTRQPSVLCDAPVPHCGEDHFTEAAMKGVHVEAKRSRQRARGDISTRIWRSFISKAGSCWRGSSLTRERWPTEDYGAELCPAPTASACCNVD